MYKLEEVKLHLSVNKQTCGSGCGIQLAGANLNLVKIRLQKISAWLNMVLIIFRQFEVKFSFDV